MPHAVMVRHCIFDICDWEWKKSIACNTIDHRLHIFFSLGVLVILFLISVAPLMILPQTSSVTLKKFSNIKH